MKDTKLTGKIFQTFNDSNAPDCMIKCIGQSGCAGWDYNNDTKVCNLYSSITGINTTGVTDYSGEAFKAQNPRTSTYLNNTTCEGSDKELVNLTAYDTYQDCANSCINNKECNNWTYIHPFCMEFSGSEKCYPSTGTYSGYIQEKINPNNTCERSPNHNIFILGAVSPTNDIGINGQLFINILTNDIYYKSNNVWHVIGNLRQASSQALKYNRAVKLGNIMTVNINVPTAYVSISTPFYFDYLTAALYQNQNNKWIYVGKLGCVQSPFQISNAPLAPIVAPPIKKSANAFNFF